MLLQDVIGPSYTYYAGILPLHLALFVAVVGVAVAAWNAIASDRLPRMARRSERRYGALLLALAAFILARYVPVLFAAVAGDRLPAEFRRDVTM